ncbi:MAG: InlB B-repeat-containing protein, partial [Faecousia sp.]
TFKANGYQVAQYTVRDGETLPEVPAVPEKYGYTGAWDADTDAAITADTVIEAAYTANEYHLYFDSNSAPNDDLTVAYGNWFTVPDYEGEVPDGMKFLGWNGDDGQFFLAGIEQRLSVASDLYLIPVFAADTEYWTVKFCHPDGSLENVYLVEQAAINGAEFFIADKEYSLYPDAKWELTSGDVDGLAVGEIVSTNYITVRSDVVFTAVVPDTYTILFCSEEGYLMDVRFIMENDLIGAGPVAPAKEGYTFVGWRDESGNMLDDTTVATQDAVYTPVYEKNLYPIILVPSEHVQLGVLPESAQASVGDIITIGTAAEVGYETYCVCVYYQNAAGELVPVAITPMPSNAPYDSPDMNGYTFVMPAGPVAVWVIEEANRNTAKFLVDGAIYGLEYILSGEAPAAPAEPVKEGYTFLGWKALSTGKEYPVGTEFDPIYTDETYVALFEINTYDLTYYRGAEADASEYKCILALPDGTFVEFFNNDTTNMPTYLVADVTYGDTVVLAEPMLPGYVFKGWVDENGYMHPAGAKYTMPASDVLLTAVWEEDTELSCLVRFMNGGELYDAYLAYDGQDASIPAIDPTCDGKLFKGWKYGENTYSNTGVKDFTVVASDAREMTFEAVWEDILYTVTYTDYETFTDIAYGTELVTLPAPEQEGYTFVAWQCAENGAYYFANTAFTVKGDMTFTAVWAKNDVEYTVKFFDENGNLVDIFVAEENAELTAPVYEQGRDDAEYVWVDAEHNTYLHEGESFTAAADCSYRATLIDEAQYPIRIFVESDDGELDNVATADKNEYLLGETVYVNITVPEGYVLKAVSAVGAGNDLLPIKDSLLPMGGEDYLYVFEMPAAPVAVLVELEKIPAGYTAVKFVNDGDLYDYMIVQKGSNAYAPETAPVKDGYTFIEWRSESSFVAPGGEFAVPAEAGSEIVYTAVWEAIDYMVEYRPDGGMPDPDDVHELHYGDKITLADAPVKGGYVFIGWVEESTGFLYGAGCTYTVTGDAVFTAKWEQAECVVRFLDPNSGIIYGYEALKQGEQVTAPAAPTVSGKTFLYWVNAEDDTDRVFAGAMTPALYTDTVYHAVFETSKHNISVSTEHCTVSPASFGAKEVGELIEFTVTPDADYALKLVTVSYFDGTSFVVRELTADESGVYSFYMPDAEVTITAKAVQNVYSIFTNSDAHTLIQVVSGNKAEVGQTVLFTVEVTDENYEPNNVVVVTASGKPIALTVIHIEGTFFAYAFTMPAEDVMIYADAAQGERTVIFLDSDNTLLGIVPVGAGDYVTDAPIAAREGYTFAGWERLPEKTPYDPERDAVTEDLIVRATYVGDTHTVAAGLTENVYVLRAECTVSSGNINSSDLLQTALNAETGKTVYFTVAANYDYVITDIAVVSAEGTNLVVEPTLREKKTEDNIVYYTYSFTMPAENVMIDVYTAPKLFTTSVVENIPEGGTYTINGFYTSNLWILQGETVTIDITPAEGYIVKNVYGEFTDNFSQISKVDGTLVGNTFTFPMVAKDVVVYIEYEAIVYGIDIETSNFATYKPDASVNPAKVVESLDPALTSQGIIRIVGGEDRDYTNELEQVYKIPANGEATNGTRVAFTVEEFTGYDLVSVTVTYDNGEKSCMLTYKDGVYYFDMPADDVVITAVFTEETYKVSKDAASEAHGEILINGLRENIVSADYKDEITVTVTPDDGWQVSKIYYVLADGTVLDFDAASYEAAAALTDALDTAHSITFHMPASDVTVYVEYVAIDYTVNVETQEAEVEVFYSPSNVGEQVSFEVTANYGYIISKVYVTNDTTGERVYHHTDSTNQLYGAWYTFTMPASSVTIHVETIKDEYNVKYLDNGALIAYENIEYMDTANVAAHVEKVVNGKAGYHFVGWVSSDVETPVTVPSVTDADFVVVKDTFIYAAYERDEIDVLFKATEHGTVTELSTGNTAEYRLDTTVFGDTVEFTAVPDVGYVVDTVSVTTTNGEGYNLDIRYTEKDGKYTFVIPASYKDNIHVVQAEDVIVSVTFKKDAYTLTKADDCGTNGTIAVNGAVTTQTSFTYEYQDEVTITATPDNGYYVVSVTAQNADGSTVYTVEGTKPATDTPVGDSLTLTFAMPAEDLTYTVVYAKIDYSITTVFDATQGSVATEPVGTAQLDDIVTVTVTPKEGYELAELSVTYADGEKSCILTEIVENVYTFTMPADAVVVTAIFTEITYTTNLTIAGEGSATLNGYYTDNMPADYLDTVTVTAAPAEGWELVSIEVDGGKIEVNEELKPEGGAYTFTMPSHDVEITVTFEKTGYGLESYALNFFEEGHGTVALDPETTAYVGDRVIISADPDDGYRVKSVTVIDEYGYAVPVSFISGTPGYVEVWSFTMPAAAVDIYVVFEVQGASYYDDVRTDHWFYEAVTFVTDRGYFYGISDDLFAPYMNMNRAMFVTVLGRISGVDVSKYTGIAFTDVEEGSYYAPYVAWAAENGIVIGRSAEIFDPYANITREEMAAIMYRYCDFLGVDMTPDNEVFMDRYVDRDDISDWAVTYVEWAVGAGLIRGMSDNTIDPLSYATRAQVAQVIKNLCDKVLYR